MAEHHDSMSLSVSVRREDRSRPRQAEVTEGEGHGRSWSLVANTASSGQRSRFWCPTPSKSTPRPGTRPQSPEQGIYLTRSGNTFPARCHLPGMTRKSRQTPVGWGTWRRSTASSWRRTSSSRSFERDDLQVSSRSRRTWRRESVIRRTVTGPVSLPVDWCVGPNQAADRDVAPFKGKNCLRATS